MWTCPSPPCSLPSIGPLGSPWERKVLPAGSLAEPEGSVGVGEGSGQEQVGVGFEVKGGHFPLPQIVLSGGCPVRGGALDSRLVLGIMCTTVGVGLRGGSDRSANSPLVLAPWASH